MKEITNNKDLRGACLLVKPYTDEPLSHIPLTVIATVAAISEYLKAWNEAEIKAIINCVTDE